MERKIWIAAGVFVLVGIFYVQFEVSRKEAPTSAQAQVALGSYSVQVTIGDGAGAFAVKSLRGLDPFQNEHEIIEQKVVAKDGTEIILRSPGRYLLHDFTIRFDPGQADLWAWRKLVIDGNLAAARRSVKMDLLRDGTRIVTYTFQNAWPSSYTGPRQEGSVALPYEEMTIVHEGATRE